MSSSAKEIFDAIKTYKDIKGFITNRTIESQHLDFKTGNVDSTRTIGGVFVFKNDSKPTSSDEENWSKSLSGYANSDGGVIIWGVEASKNNSELLDHTNSLQPILGPEKFKQELLGRIKNYILPFLQNVNIKIIKDSKQKSKGYIICYIPKSEGVHMAKNNKYYKRNGDSFSPMEHWEVENLYGRNSKPRLSLSCDYEEDSQDSNEGVYQFRFWLLNYGKAVAKYPGMWLKIENATIVRIGEGLTDISRFNKNQAAVQYSSDTIVIHPNNVRINIGFVVLKIVDLNEPLAFKYKIYAENMNYLESEIKFFHNNTVIRKHIDPNNPDLEPFLSKENLLLYFLPNDN